MTGHPCHSFCYSVQGTVHGNIQFWVLAMMWLVCTGHYIMGKADDSVFVTLRGLLATSARELGVRESIWTKTEEVII